MWQSCAELYLNHASLPHMMVCGYMLRFTSDQKEGLTGVSGVTITTYTMIAFSGKRSEESARVMDQIRSREWGLLLMDEVHVVPAQMFRKVPPPPPPPPPPHHAMEAWMGTAYEEEFDMLQPANKSDRMYHLVAMTMRMCYTR